ncbi:MAG: serine/threonine protein kinase, partial [Acidobacteriota bacterium]|nr:serine/threonine protein kinase [Acidobacteriota bacterium]
MTPDRWNKIDQILDVAIELPPERRASYLAQACDGDEELRQEVESLLLAHEKSGAFIETTPARGMAAAFSLQFSPEALIGRMLGHYRIEALLGAGGMGEVYRARDSKLDRNVAIKVLPKHLSSHPDALARFEREAKAIAALPHPNILAIHDFGHEGGVTYAVMELLEGDTLRQRIGQAGIGWRDTVKIAASVAEGLAAAHTRGIIHRDIKPENIFLTADGVVKVLDFGIARVKKAVVSHAETLISQGNSETKPGTLMGTIGYMSPEQVRGDNADAPSDVFSLGCVMVEMLTGKRPFARNSAAETMAAILRDDPPSLASLASSDSIHQQVPPELERIVYRCLAKTPEERFQSARDLAFD